MERAQVEGHTFFVYEYLPGSNTYTITCLPPDRETYFKVEPNRIITTVVGPCSRPTQTSSHLEKEEKQEPVEKLGHGFWYYRSERNIRPH